MWNSRSAPAILHLQPPNPFDRRGRRTAATAPPVRYPDVIAQLMHRIHGETFTVRTPQEFADAIRHMAHKIPVQSSAIQGDQKPAVAAEEQAASQTSNDESVESKGDVDPVEVLMHVRDEVVKSIARTPNYTCIETVQREHYEPQSPYVGESCDSLLGRRKLSPERMRLTLSDRLRLDVTMGQLDEMYSWEGAARFDDREIYEIVPRGAIGTGPFVSMLSGIFTEDSTRFSFNGETGISGRRLLEYAFSIPEEQSHYRVRRGGQNWFVTAYSGTVLVDPATSELVRVLVRTAELPDKTDACEIDSTLDYGKVVLGGSDFLLPTITQQRYINRDGAEMENKITFSSCREYRAESAVHFDVASPASDGQPAVAKTTRVPAGIRMMVDLASPVSLESAAAGDRIEGRLAQAVRDASGMTVASEGTKLEGRLMRVEHWHSGAPKFVVALRWEWMDVAGTRVALAMKPRRKIEGAKNPNARIEFELPQPGEDRYGVYNFPAKQKNVDAGFRTEWVTVDH